MGLLLVSERVVLWEVRSLVVERLILEVVLVRIIILLWIEVDEDVFDVGGVMMGGVVMFEDGILGGFSL